MSIGIEGRLPISQGSAEAWVKEITQWKKLGATHLTINTMKAGLTTPADHIDAIRRFKEATGEMRRSRIDESRIEDRE